MSKKNRHPRNQIGKEEVLTFKEFKENPFEVITDFECTSPPVSTWQGRYNQLTGIWEDDENSTDDWSGTRYMC